MNESGLKLQSLGIVVEDIVENSDFLKITPIETLPLQTGDVSSNERNYQNNAPDAMGVNRVSQIKGSNYVVAKWISDGQDNRITAPTVRKGETVKLYRYSDTDEYYWKTIFREPQLRKQETALFGFSNMNGTGSFDKTSSYWLEVSTINKIIQFHTSQNDGEPYMYDIKIDTNTGTILITDNVNNSILLDSKAGTINLNAVTKITINAPTVDIVSPTINLKGNVSVEGTINATGDVHGSNI